MTPHTLTLSSKTLMEFSSLPLYLDPSNWNQHQLDNQSASGDGDLQSLVLVPHLEEEISVSATRPSSMSERARLAKIPQPEPSLKCPRCDSTNTKFCYFNNYSLSQPRHFCKTCRRYWTRGGSLRNVPVGGGCRRNKRSKSVVGSSSNKSSGSTTITSSATTGVVFPSNIFGQTPQLPFMASLQELVNYGSTNIGFNFSGFQQNDASNYLVPSSSISELDQWRFQQFPFSDGFDPQPSTSPAAGLFSFKVDQFESMALPKVSCSGIITQLASVKTEDNLGYTMPRQNFGIPGNDQYWCEDGGEERGSSVLGRAADLSIFNSSSYGNLL